MALQIILLTLTSAMIVLGEEYSVTKSPVLTSKIKEQAQELIEDNPCSKEYLNYCLNGHCVFHADLTTPLCRCDSGFTGERCEHMTLSTYSPDEEAVYIAIGIGVGLLISGVIVFIWYYWKKRCKKTDYETCKKTEEI
ncbi:hypothetical protein XENTR_v10001010 [Xenopus tropicalis]|nr:hypothetical protein XENTR_v10001010 [Xenopus tropicalis]